MILRTLFSLALRMALRRGTSAVLRRGLMGAAGAAAARRAARRPR